MSNVASGIDDSADSPQQEEGNGSHPAQQNEHGSSNIETEGGSLRAHQGYPSGNQAVEGDQVNGVHETQDVHLCSGKIMQEGYCDGVHTAQVGDSENEKLMEEDFDNDQHGTQPDLRNIGEPQGGATGLFGPQHGDQSCKQTLEKGHVDGKAESAISQENASSDSSTLPQPEKPTHAQTSHDSRVQDNLANYQETISQNGPGRLTNPAPCMTSAGKHPPDNFESGQELRNAGTGGRSQEHSDASVMASIGTLREHTHEDEGAYQTLGGSIGTMGEHTHKQKGAYGTLGESIGMMGEHTHGHKGAYGTLGKYSPRSTPACGSPRQHAGHGSVANADVFTEGGQLGKYPKNSMFGNGTVGEYAQGTACESSSENDDFGGNLYDFTTSPNANAHGKMTAWNDPGVDFKINFGQTVSSTQAPTLMISSKKSGSLLSGSSYYMTQSDTLKKIGIVSRFGSAIFSLVVFSVIISTNEKRVAAGSTFYVKFSDYQAYNYLAALNLFSFLYSSAQLVFHAQARSSNILSSPLKQRASVYLCDQMLALLMISSSSSAATASELSRHGLHNIWPPACSIWKLSLFCSRAEVAVAMSFVSFLFTLLSSFSSGYYLANLLAE